MMPSSEVALTSSAAASPDDEFIAKISPMQDDAPAWKVTDPASGSRWLESFASYNPAWSSSKTSQDSCEPWLVDQGSLLSESSSLIWPNSGMTRDGVAFELPTWELHISVPEFSSLLDDELLPTPSTTDSKGGSTPEARKERSAGGAKLNDLPKLLPTPVKTLPTPTAGDARSAGSRNLPGSKAKPGVSLSDIVRTGDSTTSRLLPTPTTQDAANTAGHSQQRRNSDPLNVVAALLPTAHARGGGSAERYKEPKAQEWIGESFDPQSSVGSPSPDSRPDQLTIVADSTPDSRSGCSDSQKDGSTWME